MPGGPGNPLGARALYIGDTAFRIHGTTEPWSIGQAVSSGCIRMMNAEVIDLYDRVADRRHGGGGGVSSALPPQKYRKGASRINSPLT